MTENIVFSEKNSETLKKSLDRAIDMGIKHKSETAWKNASFDYEKYLANISLPKAGVEMDELLDFFDNEILPYCSNFSTDKFVGFPDSGNSIGGICGAVISDLLQQNLINASFCSPVATFLEIETISWLRELLGYSSSKINDIFDVGGIITYGGTGSNSIALMLARENHKKHTLVDGVVNPKEFKVIVPKGIGHYSIKSSQMWLGCGDNVIEVETFGYRYNLEALKEVLYRNKGSVMCVVAYVGDSRTMTIENLDEVANIVKSVDSNIWLHADACHGFSLAFSDKLKGKIKGIDRFDSISTDPHKVLLVPYCISALLVKDPSHMRMISSVSDLIMQEQFAFGQITPFIGSKSWVSLKLWFALKNIGIEGFGKIIEKRCEMASVFKEKLMNDGNFIVLNEVDINSVVFMYTGDRFRYNHLDPSFYNKLNESIYQKILLDGEYYLHQFSICDDNGVFGKGETLKPLRYMSGNPTITVETLDELIKYIKKTAEEISFEPCVV